MATIGRKGDFGYLNDNLLRLQKEKDWLFITEDTSLINKYHFKKYDYYYGLVIKNTKIISAYSIYYYALYKGLKFFVENVIKNDIFILCPLEEAMIFFNDFPKQGYDPIYEIKESEVTDVWEERTPIKGFKFEEEPIVYLKKNGVWLVEHQSRIGKLEACFWQCRGKTMGMQEK